MKLFRLYRIILFLIPIYASANSFQLMTKELPAPLYRTIGDLILRATNKDISFISLEFIDYTGTSMRERITKKFTGSEFNHCVSFPCNLNVTRLPVSIERPTCFLRITTNDGSISELAWGRCEKLPAKPNDTFLPDLTFSEDPTFDSIFIQNDAYQMLHRKLNVLSYLEDKNGNLIWIDQSEHVLTVAENESTLLHYNAEIKTWQKHLGCTMRISLDANFEIHEKKKRNNEISLPLGKCEDLPDMERGDFFDFEPLVETASDKILIRAINHGRLPMVLDHEILQSEISILYSDGTERKFPIEKRGPLHGFGDSLTLMSLPVSSNLCGVSVTVNPHQVLKESNTLNNSKKINICN